MARDNVRLVLFNFAHLKPFLGPSGLGLAIDGNMTIAGLIRKSLFVAVMQFLPADIQIVQSGSWS